MLVAGVLLLCFAAPEVSAQGGARRLEFSLDRDGSPPTQYAITVGDDGTGAYVLSGNLQPEGTAKQIRIGSSLVKKLFAAVPMVEGGRCETHNKGIAKTGVKVLRYTDVGRDARCTYNFSDDDRVNDATSGFEGIAETMQIGERLRAKLRFDRLGLDTELDVLQGAVTDGRALEVGNIAPVLRTIADDERVMDRARRKAERLLAGSGSSQTAAGGASSLR